jgi:hypothetical protein
MAFERRGKEPRGSMRSGYWKRKHEKWVLEEEARGVGTGRGSMRSRYWKRKHEEWVLEEEA